MYPVGDRCSRSVEPGYFIGQGPCWATTNCGAIAPERVQLLFLVGSSSAGYFLISEIEQEPRSCGQVCSRDRTTIRPRHSTAAGPTAPAATRNPMGRPSSWVYKTPTHSPLPTPPGPEVPPPAGVKPRHKPAPRPAR